MNSQNGKENASQIKAALIAGGFALAVAIVSGIFLIINTLIQKGDIVLVPTSTPGTKPSASYTPTIVYPQIQTTSPDTVSSNDSSILFSEDFEDGRAQNFSYISGDWKIVQENTGNKVYEIDNSGVSGFSSTLSFGLSTWQNYEMQYRVKMLNLIGYDVPEVIVCFNYDDNNSPTGYVLNLQPSSEVADLVPVKLGQWQQNGISRRYTYSSNVWYDIRIVAQKNIIQIYINNALITDTDFQTKAGNIQVNTTG